MGLVATLSGVVGAGVEAGLSGNGESFTDVATRNGVTVSALVVLVVVITLVLLLGKWLWNNALCKHVTIVKPVATVWDLLLVMFALDLVLPNCRC